MRIIILACCIGLLASCSCDDDKDSYERTILVYIAGDNNLFVQVAGDIEEMMEGSRSMKGNQRLIAFVDSKAEQPYILHIMHGDTLRVRSFKREMKSSDAGLLKEVMQWTMKKYPSKSYGLVLWGHADGWILKNDPAAETKAPRRAYGMDDGDGFRTWMDVTEMANALYGTVDLDFIFADCCAFQSVETAYELRKVTKYIIASPAEIPSEGAPYSTLVPALFDQSSTFYERIVDAYFEQTTSDGMKEPLSVIETAQMDNLASVTKEVLKSFVPQLPDSHYPNVSGLIYYFKRTLFDMNDFFMHYASDEAYTYWKQAFDKAVVYKTYTSRWRANYVYFSDFFITEQRYGGVNMYVPQDENYVRSYRDDVALQNKNIHRMQWYHAAGLDELGW